jgi:hypothetical protein
MEFQKTPSEIVRKLRSEVTFSIQEGLKEFRKKGNIEELSEVIFLLKETSDQEIFEEAKGLINDLKIQAAVPHLVTHIQDEAFQGIHETLISACWQSGLDFSGYLPVFSRLVRESPYLIAFEALTVIENCTDNTPRDIVSAEIPFVKDAIKISPADKISLLKAFLEVLEEKSRT